MSTTTARRMPKLTSLERCDRCGAAATTTVILTSEAMLLFCGHHTAQHRVRLESEAAKLR